MEIKRAGFLYFPPPQEFSKESSICHSIVYLPAKLISDSRCNLRLTLHSQCCFSSKVLLFWAKMKALILNVYILLSTRSEEVDTCQIRAASKPCTI